MKNGMKTKQVMNQIKFLEEKHINMSDRNLIDNLKGMINLLSNTGYNIEKRDNSARNRTGDVSDAIWVSRILDGTNF